MKFEDQPNVNRTFEHRFYADINTGKLDNRVTVRYDHDDETLRFHLGGGIYLTFHRDDFDKLVEARDELLPPPVATPPHQASFVDWESGDEITAVFNSRVQADMFVETCREKGIPAWRGRRGQSLISQREACCTDPDPHAICEV